MEVDSAQESESDAARAMVSLTRSRGEERVAELLLLAVSATPIPADYPGTATTTTSSTR